MRKQFHPWFRVLAVAVLMATLMLSGCSVSSQSPIQTSSIADKVPNEGVIVHGHWIIEVKNPDGTLIERREFDNALMSDGRELLVKLLARQTSLGGWIIRLMGAPTTGGAFMNESGVRTSGGIIVESTYTGTGPHIFKKY